MMCFVPESVLEHRRSQMAHNVNEVPVPFFLHIAKTAGRAVLRAFESASLHACEQWTYLHDNPRWGGGAPGDTHCHVNFTSMVSSHPTLTLVRDPLHRFVSEILHSRHSRHIAKRFPTVAEQFFAWMHNEWYHNLQLGSLVGKRICGLFLPVERTDMEEVLREIDHGHLHIISTEGLQSRPSAWRDAMWHLFKSPPARPGPPHPSDTATVVAELIRDHPKLVEEWTKHNQFDMKLHQNIVEKETQRAALSFLPPHPGGEHGAVDGGTPRREEMSVHDRRQSLVERMAARGPQPGDLSSVRRRRQKVEL